MRASFASTRWSFYRAAGLTDITVRVWPGARHEVFNETNRFEVIVDLVDWLDTRLVRASSARPPAEWTPGAPRRLPAPRGGHRGEQHRPQGGGRPGYRERPRVRRSEGRELASHGLALLEDAGRRTEDEWVGLVDELGVLLVVVVEAEDVAHRREPGHLSLLFTTTRGVVGVGVKNIASLASV